MQDYVIYASGSTKALTRKDRVWASTAASAAERWAADNPTAKYIAVRSENDALHLLEIKPIPQVVAL